jgi:DNA polymerase-3 subunit epsilon
MPSQKIIRSLTLILNLVLLVNLISSALQFQQLYVVTFYNTLALSTAILAMFISLLYWFAINKKLLKPLASLLRGTEIILQTHASHELEIKNGHWLGRLPELVHALGDEISSSQNQITRALKTGASNSALQQKHLEKIIRGLDEGVIVCDKEARMVLYNPSAARIIKDQGALGLGRSLYDLIPKPPVEHTLQMIVAEYHLGPKRTSTDFLCTPLHSESTLHCRLGLLAVDEESALSQGFVITFYDVTSRQGALRTRNTLLRRIVRQLRRPLGSLRAASETISTSPEMSTEDRSTFNHVVLEETLNLCKHHESLAQEYRKMLGGELVTSDVYSSDVIHNTSHRLEKNDKLKITLTGLPIWIRVDSHAMVVLLEFYICQIAKLFNIEAFDLEADQHDHKVYLDLSWQGPCVSDKLLSQWQEIQLPDVIDFPSVRDVLKLHNSIIWSQPHPRISNTSILRIPVPASQRQWEHAVEELPSRPMIYDFNLAAIADKDRSIKTQKLRDLHFVVFDTETTGLNPEQGDEIVSIAGVRVVNQRILLDETFDQLVHPDRSIPKSSIRFHGITDEMVKEAPKIDDVLPTFNTFVGDSVLVAHNAWFDMKFLKRREVQSGVRFNNPILDTLMLSVVLHGHDVNQSLDAILDRLGIEVIERHSALSDSLATAELLLSLIDLLEAQGILTLEDALRAYK